MNKLFKKIAMLAFGAVMAVGVGVGLVSNTEATAVHAAGEPTLYKTAKFGPTYNSASVSSYTASWSSTTNGFKVNLKNFNNNNNGWEYVRCGSKNGDSVASITTNSAIDKAIGKIVLKINKTNANNINSQNLYISSDSTFDTNDTKIEIPAGTGDKTISISAPAANCYYKLEWDCKKSSNGFVELVQIDYYSVEIDDGSPKVTSISLSQNNYTKEYTTDDSWSTEGLNTVVTMSDESEFSGEVQYTFTPATPYAYYKNSATKLTVVASAQGKSSDPLDITGLVVTPANGSEWDPFTVTEAIEKIDSLNGATDSNYYYVTGLVKSFTYSSEFNNSEIVLVEGDKEFTGFRINKASPNPGDDLYVAAGYTVVLTGQLKLYGTTYEACYGDLISSIAPAVTGLKSIEVYEEVTKTMYEPGETFSSEGLVLKVTDSSDVVSYISEGFTTDFDGYTFTEEDEGTITVTVSYTYEGVTKTTTFEIDVVIPNYTKVTDVINQSLVGITDTKYVDWSGKTGTSGTVYAGQSAGDKGSVQLRSNNSNSGVITTKSVGKALKVVIEWQADTVDGRTLQVYGSHTAYTAATQLYDANTDGDKLGEIKKGTSTELILNGDYEYLGFRSASGAMYITSISITWAVPKPTPTDLFAQSLLDLTGTICGDGNLNDNATQLEGAWDMVTDAWEALEAEDQAVFTSATASETGSVVEQAAARYDYIVGKYLGSGFNDFASRNPAQVGGTRFFLTENTVDYTALIIVATVAILGVSALIIIKRRRSISE